MTSSIETIIRPETHDLGGFTVKRVLPSRRRKMVGPFIFVDHAGPATFEPGQGVDVRPHPHIGLATVTYLFEGALLHRDSLGFVQPIRPGDVNWMTAGSGIVHSERTGPEERTRGHRLHGMQVWVALPKDREEVAPDFRHHSTDSLPRLTRGSVNLTIIVGTAFGQTSPVQTLSDMFYVEAQMPAGSTLVLPPEYPQRALYTVNNPVYADGSECAACELAVLAPGSDVEIRAEADTLLMLLGGCPLDGERYVWWNFVGSSRARIEKAKGDWAEDRFAKVPGETEFIPLPD